MNLKKETLEILKEHKKGKKDILWCGSEESGWFTFKDFMEVAPDNYDDGYGFQEIAKDLLIVGKDFWLERNEYDGCEWWEYKTMPIKPENYNKPKSIIMDNSTLKEIKL